MSLISLYPNPESFPAPVDANGDLIPTSGISVEYTDYYVALVRSRAVLMDDPLGVGNPVVLQPGEVTGVYYATNFGVRADGVRLTDVTTVGGSLIITSPSAPFSPSDVGKKMVLSTPSDPHPSLVSVPGGSGYGAEFMSGTLFDTIPAAGYSGGLPLNGGCFELSNGQKISVHGVLSPTVLWLNQRPATAASGLTMYREMQLETTITGYISPTQVYLAHAPLVSGSGRSAFYGTDNYEALSTAITSAFDHGMSELRMPAGLIGIGRNMVWSGRHNLRISGEGMKSTCLVDLRKSTTETIPPPTDWAFGVLSFHVCNNITLSDFAYDGLVPVIMQGSTTGEVTPGGGGRKFVAAFGCQDMHWLRLGSEGLGSRDEYVYLTGIPGHLELHGFRCEDCVFEMINVNAVNNGNTVGAKVLNNNIGCAYQALLTDGHDFIITGNTFTQPIEDYGSFKGNGTALISLGPSGTTIFANNTLAHCHINTAQNSILAVYGEASAIPAAPGDVTMISNNTIRDCSGAWSDVGGFNGCIGLGYDYTLNTVIQDNWIDVTNAASGTHGNFVYVNDGIVGNVYVDGNTFFGRAGSNMAYGVIGESGLAAGSIVMGANNWGPSVTTKTHGDGFANQASLTVDVPSISAGTTYTSAAVTITGAALGDFVEVSCSVDLGALTLKATVTAANTVKFTLANATAGAIDPGSATYYFRLVKR